MGATLGLLERPLGPARWVGLLHHPRSLPGNSRGKPHSVRAVIGFGASMLLAHADGQRGREAPKELEFYAHADLFMNPTAEMADIVLPVALAFEPRG
jgi:anaerobic selenocysteine-containing dehydrogenase